MPGAICVTVGAVIGVGIFVIVGSMGAKTGAYLPFTFLLASLPAVFGTLVAISLGTTIPADGGGFYYTKSLLGNKAGWVASWLVVIGALGSTATVAIGVADYIRGSYLPNSPHYFRPLVGLGIIGLTWGINALGIMASEKFQIATVLQFGSALLIVIIAALIGGGNPDFSQGLPVEHGVGGFVEASIIAALSYTGFNIIGELGDEVDNPRRNIPLTIIIGLLIIILMYVGVGWVVSGSMTVNEMNISRLALVDTGIKYLPEWFKHYLNLAALGGAITSINAVFLAVPREFYAQAEVNFLPKWIMKFNPKRQTFPVGMAIVAIVGALLVLLNFSVDIYGLLCVAGLILANFLFSVGVYRIFKLFPKEVASAPIKLKRWWLQPSAVISAVLSLGFGVLAIVFLYQEVGAALVKKRADNVISYWYGDFRPSSVEKAKIDLWFKDKKIKGDAADRFREDVERAVKGEYDFWKSDPRTSLALIIILQQMPDKLPDYQKQEFDYQKRAQELALYGLKRDYHIELPLYGRLFYYMPLAESDDPKMRQKWKELYAGLLKDSPEPVKELLVEHYRPAP
ncbi:MAG: amino acid permease [bacterium]